MKEIRKAGNYAAYLAIEKRLSDHDIAMRLGCTADQIHAFYKGRYYLSLSQIIKLADILGVSLEDLMNGNEEIYDKTVTENVNDFSYTENREKILNLIDGYMDVSNAVINLPKINKTEE